MKREYTTLVKQKKDGTPIKREQEAIDDLKTIFDDVRFIPYDK